MAIPLLRTKLLQPQLQAGPIRRERLLNELDLGLTQGRRLTLVSAQAGAGKTTLLADWLHGRLKGRGWDVGWLALDPADNEPTRFLTYLLAALQQALPALDGGLMAVLDSPQAPPVEALLTALINQLSELQAPVTLVLDDYHVIEELAIHQALAFLLEHQPPSLHLVVATRADPALPLARLRARNQLTELRAADLRFTAEEAAAFLNDFMGLRLVAGEIAALEARTEGWIVGLQLAALSLRGKDSAAAADFIAAFSGTQQFVLDYLAEEVFQQQPDPVQSFMLQTAILDRLCGPLCDAVTLPVPDTGESQMMLERLVEANLFVLPLDEERRWFRYHRLFADLLRQRLERSRADQTAGLHGRAAGWLAANGFAGEAFDHWLAAGAYDEAARLVEEQGFKMLEQGQLVALLGWLARLPEGVILAKPWLAIYHAWALLLSGQAQAVESRLEAAEQALETVGPVDRVLRGHIAAIRAYLAALQGAVPQAIALAHSALALLPEEAASVRSIVAFTLGGINYMSEDLTGAAQAFAEATVMGRRAGNIHVAAPALRALGNLQAAQGRLHQAAATYREALGLVETPEGRPLPLAAGSLLGLGDLAYEWNDLAAAEEHIRASLELSRQWGHHDSTAHSLLSLAQVQQARGDIEAAGRLLAEAAELAQQHTLDPTSAPRLAAMRMGMQLSQGEIAVVLDELGRRGLSPESTPSLLREAELVVLVRALLASGQARQARMLAGRLVEAASLSGRQGDAVRLLALSSLGWQAEGKSQQALADLGSALRLGRASAMVRSFVDLGDALVALLRQVPKGSDLAGYASCLLDAFGAGRPSASLTAFGEPEQPLVDPLSPRELEVLALIAEGLSNRQIADELIISVGTVKAHTSNIYGKLGVGSRAQAMVAARQLGILK
jgi:LuxR family maltose regulon positive regulatory protein